MLIIIEKLSYAHWRLIADTQIVKGNNLSFAQSLALSEWINVSAP